MGLNERRLLQKIKEETSVAEKELQAATGLDITLVTDEKSFPEDDYKVLDDFFVRKIYGLTSILEAIVTICKDEMGKEALAEKVKGIVLINTSKNYQDKGYKSVELQDGSLRIHCGFNQSTDSLYKPKELATSIETLL